MNVYIAGRFEDRARLALEAEWLGGLRGYVVVSSWLQEPDLPTYSKDTLVTEIISPELAREYAVRDLGEIKRADLFILDTQEVNVRAGREVEWGISLTRMIPRYIVGPSRNVFHQLVTKRFKTWTALRRYFEYGQD